MIHPSLGDGTYRCAGNTAQPAQELLDRADCFVAEVTSAYQFLVERGLDREPQDGLVICRKTRPLHTPNPMTSGLPAGKRGGSYVRARLEL